MSAVKIITQESDVPCARVVNENLRLVEEGKPLNLPLRYLNQSCDFKKRYKILCDVKYGRTEEEKKIGREYYKKNKEKVNKWHREYRKKNKEKVNKWYREYYRKKKQESTEKFLFTFGFGVLLLMFPLLGGEK